MLVIRGVPKKQLAGDVITMDGVDRGVPRSVADQLGLHGFTDTAALSGACNAIAKICCANKVSAKKFTVPQTLAIIALYKESLRAILAKRSRVPGLRSTLVLGVMAFARNAEPAKVDQFYESVVTGVNLSAGSPALVLRNHLLNSEFTAKDRTEQMAMMLYAILQHLNGKTMDKMCFANAGVDYFRQKQIETVTKVVQLFL